MNRRATYLPRQARRAAYREHVAAALGFSAGMLATVLLVIAVLVVTQ